MNYIYLNIKQRSNSYLENYNKSIKQFLSPFLSQKRRTIIPWPLFITFIKNEENYYSKLIKDLLTKYFSHNKSNNIEKHILETNIQNNLNFVEINKKLWLHCNNLSCRYDAFTFVFFTTIYSILINDISL